MYTVIMITLMCMYVDEEIMISTVGPTSIDVRSPTERVQPSFTECRQQDHALLIGVIVAVSLTIFIAISTGLIVMIIVVCCYSQRKCQS